MKSPVHCKVMLLPAWSFHCHVANAASGLISVQQKYALCKQDKSTVWFYKGIISFTDFI